MSTNRNIVEMVEAIRKGTGGSNSADGVDGTYMADVLSVKPLTIKMHNTTITKNLYINPALMLNASDSGEDIKKPFITPFEPQEAYEFLKEFHEKYVLTDCFPVPLAGVDVIIGYRADDSYFSYARDFISGVISYEQLGKAMQLGSLGEQYCLKTEKAFQHLKFIAKEHVPSAEWYSKKMLRDRNARNGYKDMEKETYHRGELYISRIIDEEMKSDDLFLR